MRNETQIREKVDLLREQTEGMRKQAARELLSDDPASKARDTIQQIQNNETHIRALVWALG